MTRSTLALTTDTPNHEFSYEFQLPVSPLCLKVISVDEDVPGDTAYRIEGDKLLSDSSTMKIKYIAQLSDTESYDPLLTEAVEVLLASYLAMPITGDKGLAGALREEYFELVGHNLAIDGQQGSKDSVSSIDLLEVR
jgi:hypothetical protein